MSNIKSKKIVFIDVVQRIKELENFKWDHEVGELLGFAKATFSARKTQGNLPEKEIEVYCLKKSINVDWLLTGEGPMRLDATSENQYNPSDSNTLDNGGLESSEVDKWKEKCLELSLENRDLRLKVEALEGNTQEKLETQGRRKKAL